MTHICAWCECQIAPTDGKNKDEVTHGICKVCSGLIRAELRGVLKMNEEEKAELKEVKRIRNYYRHNFANGQSDECFFTWLKERLEFIACIEKLG